MKKAKKKPADKPVVVCAVCALEKVLSKVGARAFMVERDGKGAWTVAIGAPGPDGGAQDGLAYQVTGRPEMSLCAVVGAVLREWLRRDSNPEAMALLGSVGTRH